jgi:hypothetical protein
MIRQLRWIFALRAEATGQCCQMGRRWERLMKPCGTQRVNGGSSAASKHMRSSTAKWRGAESEKEEPKREADGIFPPGSLAWSGRQNCRSKKSCHRLHRKAGHYCSRRACQVERLKLAAKVPPERKASGCKKDHDRARVLIHDEIPKPADMTLPAESAFAHDQHFLSTAKNSSESASPRTRQYSEPQSHHAARQGQAR